MSALAADRSLLEAPRHPAMRIAEIPGKGRGVIAGDPIAEDDLLEVVPVLPFAQRPDGVTTSADDYCFYWDEPPFEEAVAFGMLSLMNHSPEANAIFVTDIPARVIRVYAARAIAVGEEITINYGIPLWFEYQP